MKAMRIVHVVNSMDPATGGPPAVAARLAAAQAAAVVPQGSVAIVSHESPGRQAQIDDSLKGIPSIQRVVLRHVPAELKFGVFVPRRTRELLRAQISNADVVHLHGVWDPLVWQASVEARRIGVPYFITPHGMLDPFCLRQSWLKKKLALLLAYRSMLMNARCLHLLNEDESNLIEPLRLRTPRRVIPNGVFLEEIEPLPPAGSFYSKHPELKNQPFFIFLSRLHHKKGLDYLAEAFGKVASVHPEVRLVVAGPDGGAQADFEQRVSRTGMRDRVHLVGSIYGREKFAALVDAVCFCLPSRQEGFSMAVTESIACGTPVVISENCHFPEIAAAGAGEVVALDSDAVAAALDRILSAPERRREMSRAGQELVRSRYTWPKIAEQAMAMYEAE